MFSFSVPDRNDGIVAFNDSSSRPGWQTFSAEKVAALQKEGKPILIDFTAKWCLICQANHMVFEKDPVEERLAEEGVVKLVADWTKNDPVITRELSKFGRTSVPLYVLYGKDGKPVILPQVLTEEIVLNKLNDAVGSPEEKIL